MANKWKPTNEEQSWIDAGIKPDITDIKKQTDISKLGKHVFTDFKTGKMVFGTIFVKKLIEQEVTIDRGKSWTDYTLDFGFMPEFNELGRVVAYSSWRKDESNTQYREDL